MDQLDANQIAADVIHRTIKDATKSLASNVRQAFTSLFDAFHQDLTRYVSTTVEKCTYTRTPIINRDKRTYLFDLYVNTKLKFNNRYILDDMLIGESPAIKSLVVSGNAGSGKSMFMRYLFLALCENGFGRIPLFIELRNLNSFATTDLFAFMYYSIVGPGAVISQEQFGLSLRNGAFSLILDGFDEIDFDKGKL